MKDIGAPRRCETLTNDQWRKVVMCIGRVQDQYNEDREYWEKRLFDINVSEPERDTAESMVNSYTDDIDKLEEVRLTICDVTSEKRRRASYDNYVKDIAEIKITANLTEKQWQDVDICLLREQLRYMDEWELWTNKSRKKRPAEDEETVKAEMNVEHFGKMVQELERIRVAIGGDPAKGKQA